MIVYVYAESIIEVLNKYINALGTKRSLTPNIIKLSLEDSLDLEKRIAEGGRNLSKLKKKRKWYCDNIFN